MHRIDGTALPRLKDHMRDDSGPLWKKWAWFIGLWAAGVAAVGSVGWLLRWWLHP